MNTDSTLPEQPATLDEEIKQGNTEIISYKDALPNLLHILPLVNRPFFPHQVIPLVVDNAPWMETVKAVTESPHKILGLVLVRTDHIDEVHQEDFYKMGTACRLHRIAQGEDKLQIVVEGLQRFRIESWVSAQQPYLKNNLRSQV